jgi:hypothetical protein
MKKLIPIILILMSSLKALSFGQAAEMYFRQDSVISNKIYLNLKILSNIYRNGSDQDSALVDWGDGIQTWLYLSDSVLVPGVNFHTYNATYSGSHIYDSSYLNSYVIIGFEDGARLTSVNLYDNTSFFIQTVINFNVLKNMQGYVSPRFDSSLYTTGVIHQPVIYNPLLTVANSLYTSVRLVNPLGRINGNLPYSYPNETYYASADTTLTCDSTTGLFYWNYPYLEGPYDITYQASQYRNDTLVSTIMQDMLIFVSGTSGIHALTDSTSFRCYPSPSSGTFMIDMSGYGEGDKQIDIYDALGQVVYHTTTSLDKLQVDTKLVAGFSKGIYLVHVTDATNNQTAKIIIY